MPPKKPQNPLLKILELRESASSIAAAIANMDNENVSKHFEEFEEMFRTNGEKRKKSRAEKLSPTVMKIITILDKYPKLEKETHDILRIRARALAPKQEETQKVTGKGKGGKKQQAVEAVAVNEE